MKLQALIDWYSQLSPTSLSQINQLYCDDAEFIDPFNHVHRAEQIAAIFAHMFTTTKQPRFTIVDQLVDGQQAVLFWRFDFILQRRAYQIDGVSHLRFAADGRVCLHRDYWDTTEPLFAKLPWIGAPIRWLRSKFQR